jgi:hypothetical protein
VYLDLQDVEVISGTLPHFFDDYEKRRHLAESIGDHAGVAAAHTMLCNALARAGDIDDAVRHGEMAVELGERTGDERRIAWAKVMLGQCYTRQVWDAAILWRHRNITAKRNAFVRIGIIEDLWCFV